MALFRRDRIVHFHAAWRGELGATYEVRLRHDRTGVINRCHPDPGANHLIDDGLSEAAFNELADALHMPDGRFDPAGFQWARDRFPIEWSPPLPSA